MIAASLQPPLDLELTNDEILAQDIRNFIVPRINPCANLVRVEANRGVVTLSGCVGSFYYKQLWLNGAQRVAGVRRVIDEIDVATSAAEILREGLEVSAR